VSGWNPSARRVRPAPDDATSRNWRNSSSTSSRPTTSSSSSSSRQLQLGTYRHHRADELANIVARCGTPTQHYRRAFTHLTVGQRKWIISAAPPAHRSPARPRNSPPSGSLQLHIRAPASNSPTTLKCSTLTLQRVSISGPAHRHRSTTIRLCGVRASQSWHADRSVPSSLRQSSPRAIPPCLNARGSSPDHAEMGREPRSSVLA